MPDALGGVKVNLIFMACVLLGILKGDDQIHSGLMRPWITF